MYRVCTYGGGVYDFPLDELYTVYDDGVYFGSRYFSRDEIICIVRFDK